MEPSQQEVKLRCIEAASRAPIVHAAGPATGVLEVAQVWYDWIAGKAGTLGLPKKS